MKKRNTVAVTFMAVAIAASIPLGINRTLDRMRDDIESSYFYDQAGYQIGEGLEARRAAANNLISLAEKYLDKNPELDGLIDELEYRVSVSELTWYDIDEAEASANLALDGPARNLADALNGMELSEKDEKYPDQLIKQMRSEQDKINRSSYNDEARDFNAKVESLAPMALVKPMADFSAGADAADATTTQAVREDTVPVEEPDSADAFEHRVEQWADSLADSVDDNVDRLADDVDEWADNFADNVVKSVLG